MYDVLIVGGGVVGCAIARALGRYKLDVALVEAQSDVAMGASKANSAIVHAGYDCAPGSNMARVNVAGNALFDNLCRELNVPLKRIGSLVLAFTQEDIAQLKLLQAQGEANQVPGLRLLSGDEAKSLQPGLNPEVCGALYAPTGAITCPYALTCAMATNARDNGVHFYMDSPVTGIRTLDGCMELDLNGGDVCLRTRYLVNAAGLYADDISRMAGGEVFAIHPRKGEYILLDRVVSGFVQTVLFQAPAAMGKGILVAPTADGNAYLGPTAANQASKTDVSVRAEALDELKTTASLTIPKLPLNKPITSFAGLRAIADGHDFILGQSKSNPRLVQAAGICSPGLSSAPAIALETVETLRNAGLSLEENPAYNPIRVRETPFREMDWAQRAEAIARNPAYGRVICRCETVTEAEIVQAIKEMPGIPNVDAVKRRTRAGMGRCQGGFCMPRVMELIEREANVAQVKQTKAGGKSYLLVGKTRGGDDQ